MSDLTPGAALEPRTYEITRADLVAYAHASGDHNPIHQDESIALAVGLPGVIAHGMYTLALVGRAISEWTGDAEVLELGAKFVAPVVVPAEGAARVTVAGTVGERNDAGLLTLALEITSDGTKVLGAPKVTVRA
ncbi:acyl dehydratase [Pimelobacter simplex]|uniref:MaoC family protein n=1 Tax=Nocardioides simplex TaxID=2045 RepID=A0A0A1DFV9_NOCSI|nr:MaoC/PaaZ C-terminal domain-containing protein [Pimelobacter simplex]AIY16196.1 MaoC family protein [Pimelobacter simplex]MCG8151271.1 acyl dehydratase [Pimelobacter simplex]GEB12176.1 MaoC family dehydratase [Pimelobacter simplex]SFN17054.1 Acyl dehydratase [Pimelobacter simplex]